MQQETGEMAILTCQNACLYAYYVCTCIVFCSFLMYGVATILWSLNQQFSCAQEPTNNRKVPTNVLILY
jgi:hypothetical protein